MKEDLSDKADVLSRAKASGLHKAVDQFPDDVMAAAMAAAQVRSAFSPPDDPTVEPWPPMRVGGRV